MTMLNSKQQINICKREKESAAAVGLASANLSYFTHFGIFVCSLLSKLAIANIIFSYFTNSQAQQRETQNE